MSLIYFDPTRALEAIGGMPRDAWQSIGQRLTACRHEMLVDDLVAWSGQQPIPEHKLPLDAGFHELPERLLDDYQTQRADSELFQILQGAAVLRERVDRVVVLGIGGSYMGARALMDSCCQPYHNELPVGERGGRPRVYFAGNNVDNDATAGLLHLLQATNDRGADRAPWAIIVVSKSGGTLETAVALRQFIRAWRDSFGAEDLGDYLIPITGDQGKLADVSRALGCRRQFRVPDGVGGRFSIFSAVGLLPASILGIDVVKLLEGAAAMNDHFRLAPPGRNAVLDYVAVNHWWEIERGCRTRVLSLWSNALESVGLWYDQLLAESLGKQELGALPLTVVNTRDLHSRAQQHQAGRRDKIINNVIVDHWRQDSVPVGTIGCDHDQLDALAERCLPEIMTAAIEGTNDAYAEDRRPTTDLHLPRADEFGLGQLFQMLMLATVLEGRLLGINPYGQPGVENYKLHMQRHLRR